MPFSELEAIENDAFHSTLIESFTFLSTKFIDLNEGWLYINTFFNVFFFSGKLL